MTLYWIHCLYYKLFLILLFCFDSCSEICGLYSLYFATDSGFVIWTRGVWIGDECERDSGLIGISVIGGQFVLQVVLELTT